MATRTWVPLEIPISLAKGRIRSPEFKINVNGGFWIWVEVETQGNEDAVSCLIGYTYEDYCQKNNVHEMRASWSLSESGRILARGDTNRYRGEFYPFPYRARGLGSFEARAGGQYVLEVDIAEDFNRSDAFHPKLAIVSSDYWIFEGKQFWVFLLSTLLVVTGMGMILYPVGVWIRKKNDYQSIAFTFPGPLSSNLVTGVDPSVAEDSRAERPWQARIGFALLLLGITGYFGVRQWYKTRIFDAVDRPVSLAQGYLRTGPFRLNLSATHYVSVDVGGSQWYYLPPTCDRDLLKTKWTLHRDGKVVQEEFRQGWWFDAKPGLYDLDLEILSDASCLNRYHPRLRVYTDRADYQFLSRTLELMAALLAATGASLFILARRFSRDAKTVTLGLSPNHNQNIQWAQRLPLRPPMSRMPAFGMIAVTIFGFLVFLFMILAPVTPRGLWVHLLKPGQLPAKSDAWTDPLIVRVTDDGAGRDPKLLVNSKQIALDDLDRVLKQELAPRKDWVVYVTGDDAIPYQSVATVIDAARSRGAKVMLYHDPHEQPRELPPYTRPPRR